MVKLSPPVNELLIILVLIEIAEPVKFVVEDLLVVFLMLINYELLRRHSTEIITLLTIVVTLLLTHLLIS